jgi:plasmid stabilization system protein ParE
MEVIIAPAARSDVADILAWTEENFDPQVLRRYANLIATAIAEVAADPDRASSRHRPEIVDRSQFILIDCRSQRR